MKSAASRNGFTMVELLIVVGIVGIIAALATPLYVGWRADALATEAARTVQGAISDARATAKRTGTAVTMNFRDGSETFFDGARDVRLPNGGMLALSDGPVDLLFAPPFGTQTPFAPVRIDVVSSVAWQERVTTISVIPPLGKTGVVR